MEAFDLPKESAPYWVSRLMESPGMNEEGLSRVEIADSLLQAKFPVAQNLRVWEHDDIARIQFVF